MSDPLGGSYFVESLTRQLEDEALAYFETIDRMGGMVAAIERGYPQREIAESAYRAQQAVESREQVIVGVNDFIETGGDGRGHALHRRVRGRAAAGQARGVARAARRSSGQKSPRRVAGRRRDGSNTMPLLARRGPGVRARSARCAIVLREVWGEYVETPMI